MNERSRLLLPSFWPWILGSLAGAPAEEVTSGEADGVAQVGRTPTPRGEDTAAPELEERGSGVTMGTRSSVKRSFLGHSRQNKLGRGRSGKIKRLFREDEPCLVLSDVPLSCSGRRDSSSSF